MTQTSEIGGGLTSNMVAISSCASSSTVDIWGQVMKFLADFVCDDGTSSGSGIRSEGHTSLQSHTDKQSLKSVRRDTRVILIALTSKTAPQMVVPVLV